MSAPPRIVPWKGLDDWRGEALPEYDRFNFADIPWIALRREGRAIDDFECVKSSNSRRVLRFTPAGGPTLYIKRYLANNWRRQIGVRLRGTRAGREFHLGYELLEAGVATPEPLAWAAHLRPFKTTHRDKSIAVPAASYLLTREWANQGSVRDWFAARRPRDRTFIGGLARFIADAHDRGFYHDDCAAEHVLVAPEQDQPDPAAPTKFAFIDVDNGRMLSGPIPVRLRVSNLFQVLRSIPVELMNEQSRREFLKAYLDSTQSVRNLPFEDCVQSVERLARKKVARSVMHA